MGGFHVEAELLKQAYRNSLKLAVSKGLKTVAFPSIGAGAYGYPIEEACQVALGAVKGFLEKEDKLERGCFRVVLDKDFQVYADSAKDIFQR